VSGVAEPSLAELRKRADGLAIRDAARLGRRLKNLRGAKPEKLQQLADQIAAAETLVASRQAAVPTITYPDLPVSERRQESAHHVRSASSGSTGRSTPCATVPDLA
jgi:ATP-dependent helicase HrpA